VAEQGPRPACEHSCHATSVSGQTAVTNGIDTEMYAMKPPGRHSPLDGATPDTHSGELSMGDDTMLTGGQISDP
jgi:hypothetical protein